MKEFKKTLFLVVLVLRGLQILNILTLGLIKKRLDLQACKACDLLIDYVSDFTYKKL